MKRMGWHGQTGPGPAAWTDIAQTPGHMDSSHLAGHTDRGLQSLSSCTTPQKHPFLPQRPHSETSRVRPLPSAPVIHVSVCPGSVHQSHLTLWGRGGSPLPHPDAPSGTWGLLWGVPGQAPNTHLHPWAPAAPFCPGFTPNRLCSAPHPQPGGAG